jgi:hypothetical protein
MKQSITIILLALLSVFLPACSNDSDDLIIDPAIIENNLMTGTWRIDLFRDSGDDETNHFTGYSFSFNDNGVLIATNGGTTHIGTWSVTDNNSNDDSLEDLDVNIFFATPADFQELSEDWGVVLYTDDRLELIHTSGGGGGTDNLHFVKQ